MKHILFITSQDLWGESDMPQRAPGRTLMGYIRAEYRISIVSTDPRNTRYRRLCPGGFFPVVFNSRTLRRSSHTVNVFLKGFFFPLCAAILSAVIDSREKIDVVYGYEVHGVLGAKLAAWLLAVPFVARFQGTVLDPILTEHRLDRLLSKIDHLIAFKAVPDITIMTDDGTRGDEVFRKLSPAPGHPFFFWRNGIDMPDRVGGPSIRKELGIPEDCLLVVTACRLVRWKGVDKAIRAFAECPRSRNAYLLVIGDGPERSSLSELAKNLHIDDWVVFLGHVEQADVQRILPQADVFLSFYELSNVGNPLFEAMGANVAILTIDAGDTGSVVKDGVNGLLLGEWNLGEASVKLERLLDDESLRSRLARNAFSFVKRSIWSWQERIDAELAVVGALPPLS